jgi:NAD(P)-dependent dehydrogenase (short-subunit alcohol dehydrogenase family)
MESLQGKVAIVTGGGSGIGRGIALALAREGARVVVCGRRRIKLDETVNAIQEISGVEKVKGALAVQADVSQDEDVSRLVNATLEAFGRVDILVNNAGISEEVEFHRLDAATWDRVMNVNLRGPFLTMRAVIPIMRENRSGHIINISSESGLNYYKGDSAYGTSKHALNDLGEYVQRENQGFNIRVNTICPGMVVSEMTENSAGLDLAKCLYPEDIADLVIWLLSRRQNIKIGTPILIQTMLNPWE